MEKLRVILEVLENFSIKYPETKEFIEENVEEVFEQEHI